MSYREKERKRSIQLRDKILRDPGDGLFFNKKRDFVLNDATLNLWAGIRADARDYFKRNNISWWMGDKENEPTGHMLSSQVACLNHLYPIRQRQVLATEILKKVDSRIIEAVIVDDGFVEFEAIGKKNYLNEKAHTRGANCTSIDALMVGKKKDGNNVLVLIEWKYTEEYRGENKYIPERYNIYNDLLKRPDCPISVEKYESLYYEPFYQLMRQTLLGWLMVLEKEYFCDEYIHIHVVPRENKELLERVTSPYLRGSSMSEAWKNVLRDKNRYVVVSPQAFVSPIQQCQDTQSILSYLQNRYWKDQQLL